MKNAIILCLVIFLIAVLAIFGWHTVKVNQADASRLTPEQRKERMTPVSVNFEVSVPSETPPDQPLFLAGTGTLGAWDAAGVQMVRRDNGTHAATVEMLRDVEYEFKVTRGTWSTVERGPEGEEIPDHVVQIGADTPVPVEVAVEVGTWVDQGKSNPTRITYTGDIRLHKAFASETLENERDLIVYLPPGYEDGPQARYPVLYMQDGQNLMDEPTAFAGIEWGVDETAQELIAAGRIKPIIIVGIYNSEQRDDEYVPDKRGAAYGDFVVNMVKPLIDSSYRTLPDRENTALIGSGLGAVISLDMARRYAETFGMVGALSPWHWDGQPEMLETWDADRSWMAGTRFWLDAPDLAQRLESAGLQRGSGYELVETEDVEPNEDDWGAVIGDGLIFFFGR